MQILHFNHTFFARSETFIRRFVEKSASFSSCAVAGGKIESNLKQSSGQNIPSFQLPKKFYTRKSLRGAMRFFHEKMSGQLYREKAFAEYLKSFEPDMVHCHFGTNGVYFMEILEKFNLDYSFATTFYGFDASSLPIEDEVYREKLPGLWKKGAAFFAEGPAMAEKIIALGAPEAKVHINPLLIPVEEYPQKQHFRKAEEPIRFLMIGRFVEKKGFHLFLQALGKVKEQLPPFEVNIVGYGEMEETYKEIASTQGMADVVHFLGGKDHNEVLEALVIHDFFVHPSLTAANGDSEGGAPTIILEAQTVGIPVITSNHADIPFIMGYHDFLCKENDLQSLQKVIQEAVAYSGWKERIEKGREKVISQHSYSNNTKYEELITNFLVAN